MSDKEQRRHIVVTLHGIRTYGRWQERLKRILSGERRWQLEKDENEVLIYRYGVFTLFSFVIPFLRNIAVKQFRNYLEAIFDGPRPDRVDIVAHSFGTYLAVQALASPKLASGVRIHTAILCGSVLPPNRNLSHLLGSERPIGRIINECGIQDGVLLLTLPVLGVGMAGRLAATSLRGCGERRFRLLAPHIAKCQEDKLTDRWPANLAEQRIFIDELKAFAVQLDRLRRGVALAEMQRILEALFGERPARDAVRKYTGQHVDDDKAGKGFHILREGSIPALGSAAVPAMARPTAGRMAAGKIAVSRPLSSAWPPRAGSAIIVSRIRNTYLHPGRIRRRDFKGAILTKRAELVRAAWRYSPRSAAPRLW